MDSDRQSISSVKHDYFSSHRNVASLMQPQLKKQTATTSQHKSTSPVSQIGNQK
jgi:hypothetical protein